MSRVNKYFNLPLSGQIIGVIFNTLQIRYPDNISKDVQRYFRGKRVHDETREEILWLMADKVVKDGILPYPKVFDNAFCLNAEWKSGLPLQIVRELKRYSKRWDEICSRIRAWRIPENRREEIFIAFFRLVIIDLAVRRAALAHLLKEYTLDETVPVWACEKAGSNYLKLLKQRCVSAKPSNEDLTKAIDVSKNAFDSWIYANQRPSRDHLLSLAHVLSSQIPGTEECELFGEMNRFYFLASLSDLISEQIGREKTLDMISALYRLSSRFLIYLNREESKPVEENFSYYIMLLFHGLWSVDESQIKYLWANESDPEWKEALASVKRDWFLRIMQVVQKSNDTTNLQRTDYRSLSQHISSINTSHVSSLEFEHTLKATQEMWGGKGWEAFEFDSAMEQEFRQDILIHPRSAKAHLKLGVFLTLSPYMPERINEGLLECQEAVRLNPKWDAPRIEIASILVKFSRYEDASKELEEAVRVLPNMTARLAYSLGFVKMIRNDFAGAIQMFEDAINKRPEHALAYDNAAHCCFKLHDRVKANRYAKRAHHLGVSVTYNAWRNHQYDRSKPSQKTQNPWAFLSPGYFH